MHKNVLTIVSEKYGALDQAVQDRAAQMLKSLGVERLEAQVLETGKAIDFFFEGERSELHAQVLEQAGQWSGLDVFVQINDDARRKRLLMADMDATIVQGETLDELAARFDLKDKVAPITIKAMCGELDFHEALNERVALLKDKPASEVFKMLEDMKYSAGAERLVKTMNRFGAKCILISGGFDLFTGRVAQTLGFYKNFGNSLGIEGDRLTGYVTPPIVDKDFKKRTLETEARALGLERRHVMAVGDGANDIPMLQAAGVGVGYFGKPAVLAATPHQVRCTDLTSLLYMQGYKAAEIAI